MPRPETRLDQEYDPAERHDLDRFEKAPEDRSKRHWVCCCGKWSPYTYSRTKAARESHEQHQEESR